MGPGYVCFMLVMVVVLIMIVKNAIQCDACAWLTGHQWSHAAAMAVAGAESRHKSLALWEKLLARQAAAVKAIRHRAAVAHTPGATGQLLTTTPVASSRLDGLQLLPAAFGRVC